MKNIFTRIIRSLLGLFISVFLSSGVAPAQEKYRAGSATENTIESPARDAASRSRALEEIREKSLWQKINDWPKLSYRFDASEGRTYIARAPLTILINQDAGTSAVSMILVMSFRGDLETLATNPAVEKKFDLIVAPRAAQKPSSDESKLRAV